ncbi:unnamed protein product, partial [Mesorhabditis belari]|uniref:Polypeptide N-acetylgalactosaminyltransferase n=1 Tax=Mesorhabditis belari TaxID=2138241 RepID=A0AAF3E958_9BILA
MSWPVYLRRYLSKRQRGRLLNLFLFALCGFILFSLLSTNSKSSLKQPLTRDAVIERGWHAIPDYTKQRKGPGENGAGINLEGTEREEADELAKKWFMNVIASDKISLDRSIPDSRSPQCKALEYDVNKLPTVSVVIIFTDESFSALLRTVHSVVNRSPPQLLQEIVLVDDNSSLPELGEKLVKHIERFGDLVKLIRSKERLGLIRAKVRGAREARAEVLVFLDSHCEANAGWLEPLVARIAESRSAVVCPVIDSISDTSIAYMGGSAGGIGTFWWSLHYSMGGIPPEETRRRKNPEIDYIRSPTMAGGLFAANREYFFEVGAYDEEMDIWGGENLEISFRVWMCGGSIEIIPCSHVGHIFRAGHPYDMTGRKGNKDVHGTNSKRLAEVWMDDYKRLFYVHRMGLKDQDVGDLTSRHELRKKLQCKSFKWFLDNVIPQKFVPDEDVFAYGNLQTVGGLCLDTLQRLENKGTIILGVYFCQGGGSSSQAFSFSKDYEVRREATCLQVDHKNPGNPKRNALIQPCSDATKVQFKHTKGGPITHVESGLCLDVDGVESGGDVYFTECNTEKATQKWTFQKYFD